LEYIDVLLDRAAVLELARVLVYMRVPVRRLVEDDVAVALREIQPPPGELLVVEERANLCRQIVVEPKGLNWSVLAVLVFRACAQDRARRSAGRRRASALCV
jgi:hypothetical protein